VRRVIFIVLGLVAVIYIIGGADGFRTAGTRIRRWFAPSQQEIQRSAADTTTAAPLPTPPPVPARLRNTPLTQPLSIPVQLGIVSGILVATLIAMYVSGPGLSRH
jgi:hypothetical protein